jgi:putative SOS response-associated peptidase YedK
MTSGCPKSGPGSPVRPAVSVAQMFARTSIGRQRHAGGDRELTTMRWDMPPPPRTGGPPVTNVRNTSHWRGWLKPESRCLVPFNSFAPEPNPKTKRKDVVWFALNNDRPLIAFGGIWTTFNGDRGTKSNPIPGLTWSTVS